MRSLVLDTLTNLRTGFALAFARMPAREQFRTGPDQIVALILVAFVIDFILAWGMSLPKPVFDYWSLTEYALGTVLFVLVAWATMRVTAGNAALLIVIVYSVHPLLSGVSHTVEHLMRVSTLIDVDLTAATWVIVTGWLLFILARASYLATCYWSRALLALAAIVVCYLMPSWTYIDGGRLWYPKGQQTTAQPRLDAEALLYGQRDRLDAALSKLKPQRPGVVDLYFVGFAGWAPQDVFLKEVRYARELFDRRFDTHERSLLLANNHADFNALPLATETNLARALEHIGRTMDPQEDILVLFLTSHGDENELAVQFRPLPLNPVTPPRLRAQLDAAGIQWRAIFVSACYSGSFVDALAGEATLIATASAADRQSFGCGNQDDFTYFGEALFREALAEEHSLLRAVRAAESSIGERERREGLEPSLPQINVGSEMEQKLHTLAIQLAERCGMAAASC